MAELPTPITAMSSPSRKALELAR
jgi:hypothetical protein